MIGNRRPDEPDGSWTGWQAGDYGRIDGNWWVKPPSGGMGRIALHTVVEHEDRTITVSPSILIQSWDDGAEKTVWHGFLERGVWREC